MNVLLVIGRRDEYDEMAGVLERVTPALDARREPAVVSADDDNRVRIEREGNRLHFVAAQIHTRARRDALFDEPTGKGLALDRRQPVRAIDVELVRHRTEMH